MPFFGPSFLTSLRHRALLSVRKKMPPGKHREIRGVEQTKTVAPQITRETTFGCKSASWFLVSANLIWILVPKLIQSFPAQMKTMHRVSPKLSDPQMNETSFLLRKSKYRSLSPLDNDLSTLGNARVFPNSTNLCLARDFHI